VDMSVLGIVAKLDNENSPEFQKMTAQAMTDFADKLMDMGVAKADAEAQRKKNEEHHKQCEENRKAVANVEQTRLWGLTPAAMKKLLPGAGNIHTEFSGTHHTLSNYFKIVYPCPCPSRTESLVQPQVWSRGNLCLG
jgi:hypothetical protein